MKPSDLDDDDVLEIPVRLHTLADMIEQLIEAEMISVDLEDDSYYWTATGETLE